MISERLRAVILRQLHLDAYDLADDTLASSVPGWDSLSHLQVIAAVEQEFGVRFRALEVMRLANVGDLQKLVDKKLSAATDR